MLLRASSTTVSAVAPVDLCLAVSGAGEWVGLGVKGGGVDHAATKGDLVVMTILCEKIEYMHLDRDIIVMPRADAE